MTKLLLNTKELLEISQMRELTTTEVQNVAGGFGGYISWNNKTGFHAGLFLGQHKGPG